MYFNVIKRTTKYKIDTLLLDTSTIDTLLYGDVFVGLIRIIKLVWDNICHRVDLGFLFISFLIVLTCIIFEHWYILYNNQSFNYFFRMKPVHIFQHLYQASYG